MRPRQLRFSLAALGLALVVTIEMPCVMAQSYGIAPIRVGGELSHTVRQSVADERDDRNEQLTRLRLNFNSFIWQPWFARWEAGVTLGLNRSERISDEESETTTSDANSANFLLRMFPVSRFPMELFYNRTDTRVEDTRSFLSDVEYTRYGIAQRYNSLGGTRYDIRLETNSVVDEDGREDNGDLIRLGFGRNIGAHQLSLGYGLTSVDRDERFDERRTGLDEDFEDESLSLRHRYRAGGTFNINNLLEYNDEISSPVEGFGQQFTSLQFNSFATWLPDVERPLRFTANTRVSDLKRDRGEGEQSNGVLGLNLGAIYDLTPHWGLTGSVGFDQFKQADDTSETTFESIGVRYRPGIIPLGNFEYFWSFSTAVTNFDEEDGKNSQNLDFGIGHTLSRRYSFRDRSALTFQLSQDGRSRDEFADDEAIDIQPNERLVTHGVSLRWNKVQGRTNLAAGISLNDSRDFGDDEGEFRIANLQFSGNYRLGRYSFVSGNLTYQISQREDKGIDDLTDSRRDRAQSIDLRYLHNRAFGVNRLRFKSEILIRDSDLRRESEDDLRNILLDNKRVDREWENRFDYSIGLVDLTFAAIVLETEDDQERRVLARITRRFRH